MTSPSQASARLKILKNNTNKNIFHFSWTFHVATQSGQIPEKNLRQPQLGFVFNAHRPMILTKVQFSLLNQYQYQIINTVYTREQAPPPGETDVMIGRHTNKSVNRSHKQGH